jgi:hypothetical protein
MTGLWQCDFQSITTHIQSQDILLLLNDYDDRPDLSSFHVSHLHNIHNYDNVIKCLFLDLRKIILWTIQTLMHEKVYVRIALIQGKPFSAFDF